MNSPLAGSRPAEVLVVEDNEDDVELMRISFRRSRLALHLHHVTNGEDCLAFLRHEGQWSKAPRPDIVLLDLNMPRMGGREVLEEIVKDPALRDIPVIVLTTSSAEPDVNAAYQLRCNSYIVKPVDFDQFVKVVQGITDYWFTLAVLPSPRDIG
jgi:two-component system response regulator